MPDDAIIGARYEDTVFDSEFTIVAVRSESEDDVASEEDIIVVLDYEQGFEDENVEVPLSQFRDESGISIIEVPEHAG